ncbi:MAG: hypothetical protein JW908_15245 [Anaerolineales bacterium]|nr:hypothetical protein [Anaerolineales bacterium]
MAFFSPEVFQVKPTPTIIPKVGDISIKISAPLPGQAIQGNVSVQGETNIEGFSHGELSFAYLNNPTDTWFLISSLDAPAKGELSRWDTTAITDGNYQLRLVVTLDNGRQSTVIIPGLRVRNYSPIETNTPMPESGLPLNPQDTSSTTPKIKRPTPTALPANPLALSQSDIQNYFSQGAVAALIVVMSIALVGWIKKSKRNR